MATTKKLGTDDLLKAFEGMTLLELKEFIERFEETFGVEAAAMAAPVAAAGGGGAAAAAEGPEEEEQFEFDVILVDPGAQKLQVIKEIRAVSSLGLKEAKELADNPGKPVLEKVPKDQAQAAREKIEAAGGKVEVK